MRCLLPLPSRCPPFVLLVVSQRCQGCLHSLLVCLFLVGWEIWKDFHVFNSDVTSACSGLWLGHSAVFFFFFPIWLVEFISRISVCCFFKILISLLNFSFPSRIVFRVHSAACILLHPYHRPFEFRVSHFPGLPSFGICHQKHCWALPWPSCPLAFSRSLGPCIDVRASGGFVVSVTFNERFRGQKLFPEALPSDVGLQAALASVLVGSSRVASLYLLPQQLVTTTVVAWCFSDPAGGYGDC